MVMLKGIVAALLMVSGVMCRPVSVHGYAPDHNDYKPTDYSFSYGVKDPHTGDVKHQWEKKTGDKITGHYSLVEPDGSVRSVDYTADHHNGFNAVVKHWGVFQHPTAHHHQSESKSQSISHKEVVLKPGVEHQYHHLDYKQAYGEEGGEGTEYQQDQHQYQQQEEVEYQVPQQQEEEEEHGAKQQYVYLSQDGAAEESQHHNHEYKYVLPHDKHRVKPKVTIKEEYEKVKVLPHLPIDLSLLKHDTVEKIVPIDVSVIKPIEIDVNHQQTHKTQSQSVQQELSQDQIDKYLEEYYRPNAPNKINEPQIETGFKPIKNEPQLYRTNKKPATTPGLGRFSTKNNGRFSKRYYNVPYEYLGTVGGEMRERMHNGHVARLYKTLPENGYVRYAKHIRYEE